MDFCARTCNEDGQGPVLKSASAGVSSEDVGLWREVLDGGFEGVLTIAVGFLFAFKLVDDDDDEADA
jgi:hypothetical protein